MPAEPGRTSLIKQLKKDVSRTFSPLFTSFPQFVQKLAETAGMPKTAEKGVLSLFFF